MYGAPRKMNTNDGSAKPPGDETATHAVQFPAEIDRELQRFRSRQRHAEVQRVRERFLGDPAATFDNLAMHVRDVPGGTAKRDEPELQPESRGFGEGRYALRAQRCVQNISDASGSLASVW